MAIVAIIGAATALYAATIALTQHDMKRILAYSTISQLGYMFLGLGVYAASSAIFHLFTHAFFKALLFLSAGSVMHAMGGSSTCDSSAGCGGCCPGRFGCVWLGRWRWPAFPVVGLLEQGRDHPSCHAAQRPAGVDRAAYGGADRVLHVPHGVSGVLGQERIPEASTPTSPAGGCWCRW